MQCVRVFVKFHVFRELISLFVLHGLWTLGRWQEMGTHPAPYRAPSVVKMDTHMQALQSKHGVFVNLSCKCQTTWVFFTTFSLCLHSHIGYLYIFISLYLLSWLMVWSNTLSQFTLCSIVYSLRALFYYTLLSPASNLKDCVSCAENNHTNTVFNIQTMICKQISKQLGLFFQFCFCRMFNSWIASLCLLCILELGHMECCQFFLCWNT